ncbi:glycoside hydrolase family 97 protein [Arachidicoccus terrestris]|uniref:glycoside hydrolase family 97 protein n=1 Tax=Arachidicoccus terrestris TaxID=2875539 RepID=UPI001CC3FAF2|nr:glycoside hydrolase family 97 protein [Arachidicoccus terrestris]
MAITSICFRQMALLIGVSFAGGLFTAHAQKTLKVQSPDKHLTIAVNVSDHEITYTSVLDGKVLIKPSALGLQMEHSDKDWKIKKSATSRVNDVLYPVVPQKSASIQDHYNALNIDFKNGLSLEWRVYDRGFGWRWVSRGDQPGYVMAEQANWNLPASAKTWYPEENGFYSHNERQYKEYRLDTMAADKLASLPALFQIDGTQILVTESDLFDYAGMWIRNGAQGNIHAVFPHYPKELKITSDRDQKVVSRENYIAKVTGKRSFPWRVVMVESAAKDLLTNQLVYQMARPATGDYTWVKPGKVQWDWWHYNNVYDVPFRAGINDSTYMYYIDFAAAHHIEYVLLDEGWCDTRDLMAQKKDIHVQKLATYAASKNVGILLWTSWLVMDRQMTMALDSFASWGIKGIKVDFMQRDDQKMVGYYERLAREAAKRHIMVDFHGAYKPTGWMRSLPNIMTSEGVLGNEMSKFSKLVTPKHTTTIPFIRMAAGPMDFTPGGMANANEDQFAINPSEPNTMGTRCNQMAMYVIYESPLQMLCDIPTHYIQNPKCMAFLSQVPSVWKSSVALAGEVGAEVAMAREALNGDWYIGAMTGEKAKALDIALDFLPEGITYTMQVWKDGVNADRNAKDFQMETLKIKKGEAIHIQMPAGGGYVARLVKE